MYFDVLIRYGALTTYQSLYNFQGPDEEEIWEKLNLNNYPE